MRLAHVRLDATSGAVPKLAAALAESAAPVPAGRFGVRGILTCGFCFSYVGRIGLAGILVINDVSDHDDESVIYL